MKELNFINGYKSKLYVYSLLSSVLFSQPSHLWTSTGSCSRHLHTVSMVISLKLTLLYAVKDYQISIKRKLAPVLVVEFTSLSSCDVCSSLIVAKPTPPPPKCSMAESLVVVQQVN